MIITIYKIVKMANFLFNKIVKNSLNMCTIIKCRAICAMMHLTYFALKINRQMYEYIKDFGELELETENYIDSDFINIQALGILHIMQHVIT